MAERRHFHHPGIHFKTKNYATDVLFSSSWLFFLNNHLFNVRLSYIFWCSGTTFSWDFTTSSDSTKADSASSFKASSITTHFSTDFLWVVALSSIISRPPIHSPLPKPQPCGHWPRSPLLFLLKLELGTPREHPTALHQVLCRDLRSNPQNLIVDHLFFRRSKITLILGAPTIQIRWSCISLNLHSLYQSALPPRDHGFQICTCTSHPHQDGKSTFNNPKSNGDHFCWRVWLTNQFWYYVEI